jgi:hypothetical protein
MNSLCTAITWLSRVERLTMHSCEADPLERPLRREFRGLVPFLS